MIRTIFLPLVMSAIAITAHVVAGALYRQRRILVPKDRVLAEPSPKVCARQGYWMPFSPPLTWASGWWTKTAGMC